ncbi:hypothetical protein D3C76_1165020 [compost metagenome]
MRAERNLEACLEGRVEQGVAVRGLHCVHACEVGVLGFHQLLDRIALAASCAVQAQYPVQAAVKFDHIMAAGLVVQGIDVLRDQAADPSRALQAGQGVVGHVRLRLAHPRPAKHRPRPIAPPGFGCREKLLIHHGLAATAHALIVTVVRNARRGTDTGTGQDRERLVGDELLELVELFVDKAIEHLNTPQTCRSEHARDGRQR